MIIYLLYLSVAIFLLITTLPGTIELLILTGAALFSQLRPAASTSDEKQTGPLPRLAVVVPAHNEAEGIGACIATIQNSIAQSKTCALFVIADNCSDNTAAVAEQAGAKVLIRNDTSQRGKGYALDFAFQILLAKDYAGFLVIDADSDVDTALVTQCQAALGQGYDAVQSRYRIANPEASRRARLQYIAWLAFNDLRLSGRQALHISVGILGNGFALSRATLEAVPYHAGSIAEDLEYHIRLLKAGRRVHFLDTVTVSSDAPNQGKTAEVQRSRWEGGRFRMIVEHVPGLLQGVLQGQALLLEPLAELLLLPLAYHVLLLLIGVLLPLFWIQFYAGCALLVVILHVLAAIRLNNGRWADVGILATVPFYILWKLLLIPQVLRNAGRNARWERTERETK